MLRSEEKAIFASFRAIGETCIASAWSCQEGADPPDYVCADAGGKRIGVELAEWLNENQIRESIQRERLERSYLDVVISKRELPPANFRLVWLCTLPSVRLAKQHAAQFRLELYQCLQKIDEVWPQEKS